MPIGTSGELVIEGPIIARGYINNPEATAAAFINPPEWTKSPEFASPGLASQRFYKTGDLARQLGYNSFIREGQKDTQVKICGQRIELGEIEYHLNHAAEQGWHWVMDVIQPSADEDPSLAAFYEVQDTDVEEPLASDCSVADSALVQPFPAKAWVAKEMLKRTVPAYMVPDYFIHIRRLPTTSSMKTDRKTLRVAAASLPRADLRYRVSDKDDSEIHGGSLEAKRRITLDELFMQEASADVFHIPAETISASDDLFRVGGNSIRAIHLVARLRKSGHALSVADVFKAPKLSAIATKTSLLPGHQSATDIRKGSKSSTIVTDVPRLTGLAEKYPWLSPDNIESVAPATDTQAWMLDVGETPVCGFHDRATLTPSHRHFLDMAKLQNACREVLHQQPILRTAFVQHGSRLFQVVLRDPPVEQVHVHQQQSFRANSDWSPGSAEQPEIVKALPRFHLSVMVVHHVTASS